MSLDSLVAAATAGSSTTENDDLKFIFVGGKGGVGKTTTSSAIATLLAQHRRVLLVSTDPAHSLRDAWRTPFSNEPKTIQFANDDGTCGGGSLDIMEVDPQESMQGELAEWAQVSEEMFGSQNNKNSSNSSGTNNDSNENQSDEWMTRINQFQEWLSGIPGIDEATALSTAIRHIESGRYDLIVFDTAPTGHTLKLLALPAILEQGIDKLQSWQATFWGYWQAFRSVTGNAQAAKQANLKQHVTDKLTKYKRDIQKVAMMLQDQQRTRFVAVCLAEYLSVSETQRLLQELAKHKVVASHIVVNQLVVEDALTTQQLADLEALAEVGSLQISSELLRKTVHACRLTTARKMIQQRYLQDLKAFPETQNILDGICEVPLLADEVTGTKAIQRFAQLLVKHPPPLPTTTTNKANAPNTGGALYDDLLAKDNGAAKDKMEASFAPGDVVQIVGLAKSPQFNDLQGKVTTHQNADTGRYGVSIQHDGKSKTLALQPKNIVLVRKSDKKQKSNDTPLSSESKNVPTPPATEGIMDKAKAILQDPEIKQLVDSNPRFKIAVEDCLANPMKVMKYLGDPEMSPLISKALAKM